jgi:hypothetical protein
MHANLHRIPSNAAPRRAALPRALAWACALLVVACVNLVPRHGWDPASGPVVPHDSFPADCQLCHTGSDWHTLRPDFVFDHEARTGVVLEGAHARASCLHCHNDRGPVQQFAGRGCAGCHGDPHLGRLGTACTDCHDERTWVPREMIARHDRTRFPLVGAHVAAACWRCHPGAQVGNFAGASPECARCHGDEYARAQNPNHVQLGFVQDCERCHTPLGWRPARFDHPASFPLTAGHAGRQCAECHGGSGVFTGLSTDCASCHLDDWQRTTAPSHAKVGFGQDCRQCHDTRAWRPARFDHPASFPLTGGHAGRTCAECHGPGSLGNLSTDCASCHTDDFQKTTAPSHAQVGFPTTCATCHSTTAWRPSSWQHPFPITSGPHGGRSCVECHTTPGNYVAFSCTHCHEHRQTEMADEHDEVPGYQWLSSACLQCHPNGREK